MQDFDDGPSVGDFSTFLTVRPEIDEEATWLRICDWSSASQILVAPQNMESLAVRRKSQLMHHRGQGLLQRSVIGGVP